MNASLYNVWSRRIDAAETADDLRALPGTQPGIGSRIMTSELDKAGIEAAARAIAVDLGVIPDALCLVTLDDRVDPDHVDGDGRRSIYAWRRYTRQAEAAVSAYRDATPAAPEPEDPLYRAMIDDGIITEPVAEAAGLEEPEDEEAGVPCDRCSGNGELVTDWERYLRGPLDENGNDAVEDCPECGGTGRTLPESAAAARITDLQAEVERLARQYSEVLNDFSATAHELESAKTKLRGQKQAISALKNFSEKLRKLYYKERSIAEAAEAEVNRLTKERQELIDGYDRLGAARNGITEQVWAILGGQDETRPGGCNLVGRVGELHARATTAEAEVETLKKEVLRHLDQWADGLDIPRATTTEADAERLTRAELAAARQQIERLREALAWYGEQARLCRLIHSGGDAGRHALSDDGGNRARAALRESGE